MMIHQQPNRFSRFLIYSLPALLFTATLAIVGCESETLLEADQPDITFNTAALRLNAAKQGPPVTTLVRPILFDSFGVALKAKVSGTIEDAPDERCTDDDEDVLLPGTGTATHMGRISIVQSHCLDPNTLVVTDGKFTYEGTTGAEIIGAYEGTLEPTKNGGFILNADVKITGGNVPFTDGEAKGISTRKNTIQGKVHADGSFTYKLDGWLFHHRQKTGRKK